MIILQMPYKLMKLGCCFRCVIDRIQKEEDSRGSSRNNLKSVTDVVQGTFQNFHNKRTLGKTLKIYIF